MAFEIKSMAFDYGSRIPEKFTAEGEDISPPLDWIHPPAGTAEFALICEDPDAPQRDPFVHWVVYKIPARLTRLPEGLPALEVLPDWGDVLQGLNSYGQVGYNGPSPPPGHGNHHYSFLLYALSEPLDLGPGAEKEELLDEMEGQVIGRAELVGIYKRTQESTSSLQRPRLTG